VLSACETNRSGGDGRAGLRGWRVRFSLPGPAVSLEPLAVDDQFDAALMTEFHRVYQTTADRRSALREAQLQLLHSSDRRSARLPRGRGFAMPESERSVGRVDTDFPLLVVGRRPLVPTS
jgi:CHAT domain-containing protein